MRRMLVLGGTGWLGREVARSALSSGWDVTCLARGASGDVAPGARLVKADRTSPGAYEGVVGDWDEVVELAYEPGLVSSALTALADRAAHWTLVSTVSVYRRNDLPHADESAEVVEPSELSEYPHAKVAAERATTAAVTAPLLIARSGLIVGPGDPTDRFGYWPARFSRSGPVLAPHTEGRHVQVIDVSDLADWIVRAADARAAGTVNAVGAPVPLAEFFDAVRDVTGFDGDVVHLDDDRLRDADVRHWAGPRSLPLWLPASDSGFAQRDGSRFLSLGGAPRPLSHTLMRVRDDEIARGVDRSRRSGLTRAEEAAVLDAAFRG